MSDKLDTILAAARTHATDVIAPNVDAWNAAKAWPRDASDRAGAVGLTGLYAPEEWGGQGLPLSEGIQVYEQLGLGERIAPLTARLLLGIGEDGSSEHAAADLVIAGTEGMVVSYAKCCLPIPGDDIMGYLSSGRGVVIHRNSCRNLLIFRKQPEKWVNVAWEKDIDRDFSSQITTETINKPGVLAEVAATIADCGSNIEQVEVLGRHEDQSMLSFLLQVHDRNHLAKIMRNVKKMPNVVKVTRDCA